MCEPTPHGVGLNTTYTCERHGGYYSPENLRCQTHDVLDDVRAERTRQFAKYGTNDRLEDGTGPDVPWLGPFTGHSAGFIEDCFRADYELYKMSTNGPPTWLHLVREEMAEAFKEDDPVALREELLQVAALVVSWVEKIDARS